ARNPLRRANHRSLLQKTQQENAQHRQRQQSGHSQQNSQRRHAPNQRHKQRRKKEWQQQNRKQSHSAVKSDGRHNLGSSACIFLRGIKQLRKIASGSARQKGRKE